MSRAGTVIVCAFAGGLAAAAWCWSRVNRSLDEALAWGDWPNVDGIAAETLKSSAGGSGISAPAADGSHFHRGASK